MASIFMIFYLKFFSKIKNKIYFIRVVNFKYSLRKVDFYRSQIKSDNYPSYKTYSIQIFRTLWRNLSCILKGETKRSQKPSGSIYRKIEQWLPHTDIDYFKKYSAFFNFVRFLFIWDFWYNFLYREYVRRIFTKHPIFNNNLNL